MNTNRLYAVAIASSLVLAACGGGGGSGGGSGGGVQIAVDRTSLAFAVASGGATDQVVDLTVLSAQDGNYWLSVVPDRANILDGTVSFAGNTLTVTLWGTSPPIGVTSGLVNFEVCTDPLCQSVVWSKAIPYTITAFAIGNAALTYDLVEGAVSTPQPLAISPTDTAHQVAATVYPWPPWLAIARDATSVFQVTASAAALRPGSYQAQIFVSLAGVGEGTIVPVALTVESALVPPPDAVVTLDVNGSLTGEIPVAFRNGVSPSWTARTDRGWLVLTTSSGTGAGSIQYAIDPDALGSVANWSSDVATIEIDPAGLSSVSMRLTLQKHLPELYLASPAAIPAGAPATVHLFGRGLAQLTAPGDIAVSGGTGATAIPAASDSEAVISVTAPVAGRFVVSIPNPFSIPTRSLELAADPENLWTAAKVARPGEVSSAQFDPLRNAIFAVDSEHGAVLRYQLDGAWHVDAVPVPSIANLGLAPDRETLYVTTGEVPCTGTLRTYDPDTLLAGAGSYPLPSNGTCLIDFRSRTSGIQATNEGRLWFGSGAWSVPAYFDALAGAFGEYSGPSVLPNGGSMYGAEYWASPDGSRMVISQPNGDPAYFYTSADHVIVAPSIPSVYYGSPASRDGRVVVHDQLRVYATDTWAIRGYATVAADSGFAVNAQVSPDGSKVYVLVAALSSPYPMVRVDVFDAATVVDGTTDLVKLGEFPVTDQAATCGSSSPADCSWVPIFLVGPQGDVLFLVGNEGLVVLPIPPALAGPP